MNYKLIETSYDGVCNECKEVVERNTPAYYRRESQGSPGIIICTACYKRTTTTTTPSPTAPSREEAIAQAHDENMLANERLVDVLHELAIQVGYLNTNLADHNRLTVVANGLRERGLGAKP